MAQANDPPFQQERGLIGRMVGAMIRRSVRKCFRRVYWKPPASPVKGPVIFLCSHTCWHDGYLMFLAVSKLGAPTLDWIAEFDAFPLFARVGGLPFPPRDPARRTKTVRETMRLVKQGWSLILFSDGELRRPGEPWEIGSAAPLFGRQVPGVGFVPVAIRCEMSIHQRPEAFLHFGEPLEGDFTTKEGGRRLQNLAKAAIEEMLAAPIGEESDWQVLQNGTLDVNERWDMRRMPGHRIE